MREQGVAPRIRGIRSTMKPGSSRGSLRTMRPVGSITAVTPVLTARRRKRPFSMARKELSAACCSGSRPPNQASLVWFTRMSAPKRA